MPARLARRVFHAGTDRIRRDSRARTFGPDSLHKTRRRFRCATRAGTIRRCAGRLVANKVIAALMADSAKKGMVSRGRFRCSGQYSSKSINTGSVTSMGFAINPRANAMSAKTRRSLTYTQSVRNANSALRTSLRSAIHATDSTCSGCSAKRNATNALRQRAPVARNRNANSSEEAAAWSSTLTRCCGRSARRRA